MAKNKNISDKEMLRTFNCGLVSVLLFQRKIFLKLRNIFQKNLSLMKLDLFLKIKIKEKINLINSLNGKS